jgi:uncharacterized protein YgiM (DUF1202 family)
VETEHPADEPLLAEESVDDEPLDERVEREIARRSARYERYRRKRRRRVIAFWVLFLLLLGGGVAAGFALVGSGDDGSARVAPTTTVGSGLPNIPSAKLYKVTTGVNVRAGPGTTYRALGAVETGVEVLVICQIDGQVVNGPNGPSKKWLYVDHNGIKGYITAQYVAIGAALDDPKVTAVCPPL